MATWQIAMFVVGALMVLAYFKRRSDRMSAED